MKFRTCRFFALLAVVFAWGCNSDVNPWMTSAESLANQFRNNPRELGPLRQLVQLAKNGSIQGRCYALNYIGALAGEYPSKIDESVAEVVVQGITDRSLAIRRAATEAVLNGGGKIFRLSLQQLLALINMGKNNDATCFALEAIGVHALESDAEPIYDDLIALAVRAASSQNLHGPQLHESAVNCIRNFYSRFPALRSRIRMRLESAGTEGAHIAAKLK